MQNYRNHARGMRPCEDIWGDEPYTSYSDCAAGSKRGFLMTRCTTAQDPPYQMRTFDVNLGGRSIPRIFDGSITGIGDHTDIESDLRERMTKRPAGCNSYEFRDQASMVPLPYEWQQCDYRPWHFQESARNVIKCEKKTRCNVIDSILQKERLKTCAQETVSSSKENLIF